MGEGARIASANCPVFTIQVGVVGSELAFHAFGSGSSLSPPFFFSIRTMTLCLRLLYLLSMCVVGSAVAFSTTGNGSFKSLSFPFFLLNMPP